MFTAKRLMALGIIFILFAGIWKFGLSSRWEKRYPEDWSWDVETIGGNWYPANADDAPPATSLREDPLTISSREINIE